MVLFRRGCRILAAANQKVLRQQIASKTTKSTTSASPTVEATSYSTIAAATTRSDISGSNILRSNDSDFEIPNITLDQLIWNNIDQWPEHTAIVCGLTGRSYTYQKLRWLCKRFGVALRGIGLQSKSTLAVMLPNVPEYALVLMGAVEAGVVVTGINPLYTAAEISHQIWDSKALAIVTLPSFVSKIEEAKHIIEKKICRNYPFKIITLDDKSGMRSNTIDFAELLTSAEDVSNSGWDTDPQDIAILPYSSGTTGLPKGVELTHRNLVSNTLHLSTGETDYLNFTTGDHQEHISAVLPFFHIYGMSVIMLLSLYKGCQIVCLPKFDPQVYISSVKEHKSTMLYVAPPIVLFLAHNPVVKAADFSYVSTIFSAAGGTPTPDIEKLIDKFNGKLDFRQGYGLTETSPALTGTPPNCDYSSIGVPVPNTLMKIVGEDGTALGANQRGEICAKGPQVMKGYHNNPKATAEVIDGDSYFHTGDVGYYNDDGVLYIVDRMKELIKVKGFQVAPMELEIILKKHPSVLDVAVIGVPDDRCGEKPLAFVVPNADAKTSEDELKEFVADKVAAYKQLKAIEFVDTIPKNTTGKILRRILKENYLKSKN